MPNPTLKHCINYIFPKIRLDRLNALLDHAGKQPPGQAREPGWIAALFDRTFDH